MNTRNSGWIIQAAVLCVVFSLAIWTSSVRRGYTDLEAIEIARRASWSPGGNERITVWTKVFVIPKSRDEIFEDIGIDPRHLSECRLGNGVEYWRLSQSFYIFFKSADDPRTFYFMSIKQKHENGYQNILNWLRSLLP